MQVTPSIPFSSLYAMAPRRSNAARISATASSGPATAARAARWATLLTFDVEWDCRFVAAAAQAGGPIHHPAGPAVIAEVLAAPGSTLHRTGSSGSKAGTE